MDTPSGTEPYPFGVKLLICFLCVEAAEQIWTLGRYLPTAMGSDVVLGASFWSEYIIQPVMLLAFCGLLATLLILRAAVGRIWAIIFFAANVAVIAAAYIWQIPELWPSMTAWERLRVVTTVLVEGSFCLYLFTDSARGFLSE